MGKAIGIVGSRRRIRIRDQAAVREKFLALFNYGDIIISGGCLTGADAWAEQLAKEWDIEPLIFRPDKSKLDLKLPRRVAHTLINYERNRLIAEASDYLIACVAPDRTGGTENTIKHFKQVCKSRHWDLDQRLLLV